MNIKSMLKLGCVLAIYAAAACVGLAFVYTGTATVIAERQQADLEAALKELFPDADGFKPAAGIDSPIAAVSIEGAYEAALGGETLGAVLRLSSPSYGGPIKTMVGVSADGLITGVKIMEHSDTPGLGANAASPSYFVNREKGITFYGQFSGKSVTAPFEVTKDIEAITASTITSRAVALSVKAAGLGVTAWLAGVSADALSGATTGEAK